MGHDRIWRLQNNLKRSSFFSHSSTLLTSSPASLRDPVGSKFRDILSESPRYENYDSPATCICRLAGHWRYDRSLAAVLSAGLDCREGLFSKASQVQSDRRHCRIVVFRHCCRIYRRRVCCHTFHARLYTYQRCG